MGGAEQPRVCMKSCCSDQKCTRDDDPGDAESSRWRRAGLMCSQDLEDKWLYRTLFNRSAVAPGFFIELGAVDGVVFSNTYFFEKVLGWRGVLIEANRRSYDLLRAGGRRDGAAKVHSAVCHNASMINMGGEKAMSRIRQQAVGVGVTNASVDPTSKAAADDVETLCLPMNHVLELSGAVDASVRGVDLYSIDVEGAEAAVIQTHDWRRLPVRDRGARTLCPHSPRHRCTSLLTVLCAPCVRHTRVRRCVPSSSRSQGG